MSRLTPGQRSRLETRLVSNRCIQCTQRTTASPAGKHDTRHDVVTRTMVSDILVEEIIDLAENLVPIALIGAGGIGKTSIALTVLHHDRIKQQFGHHRRYIRCDRRRGRRRPRGSSPPARTSVLKEEEDSPGECGAYSGVEELCQFNNIWTCITSRIFTPPDCKRLDVPALPMDAAHDTFYQIYQLAFHPLSEITLLATVAYQNRWDTNRLTREWERR